MAMTILKCFSANLKIRSLLALSSNTIYVQNYLKVTRYILHFVLPVTSCHNCLDKQKSEEYIS